MYILQLLVATYTRQQFSSYFLKYISDESFNISDAKMRWKQSSSSSDHYQ